MTNTYNPGSRFSLRSSYGGRIDPITGIPGNFHSGMDFAAPAGTPIPAATSGKVVYSGYNKNLGNVVIVQNDTGDYSLYGHMLDRDRVKVGQRIWPGDTIGLVGSTGERTTGNHLHYSVITKKAGEKITGTSEDGSIGIKLNRENTIDPGEYNNYESTPRYLDETKRAAQMMSGTDMSMNSDGLLPNLEMSFNSRFGKWGSSPASITPQSAPALPDSFDDRFGDWRSVPAGSFGDTGSPVLRELQRRSAAPDGPASTSASGATAATPAFQPDAVYSPTGDFYGNFPRVSAVAPAPSPAAINQFGSSSGPWAAADFNAVAQGIGRLLSFGPGQFSPNPR